MKAFLRDFFRSANESSFGLAIGALLGIGGAVALGAAVMHFVWISHFGR